MAFENLKKNGIRYLLLKLKDIFVQIKDSVRSVNGETPDDLGNIVIRSVPYARGLETESSRSNTETFLFRTAGGDTSIQDGNAWLMRLWGNRVHVGYSPEELSWEVVPIERENPITATFERDVFVAYVSHTSGTYTLTYTTAWSESPALYGITVVGTPVAGDVITIDYVAEEAGTIIQSTPQSFVATGWNLYSQSEGYARVIRYSHGYKVSGTYTSLQFSSTIDGGRTDITPVDGAFDLPSGEDSGYVWVNGGNSEDTAIFLTWNDWSEGYDGDFEAYQESEIDLSGLFGEGKPFPYGLLAVEGARDEVNLNLGIATSRIERWTNTDANLATAKASGREYEYDTDYIYIVKANPTTTNISIDGSFEVSDHGLEWFVGTDVAVEANVLYGNNLVNKLERDVVTISQQTLTDAQQTQVLSNLGILQGRLNYTDMAGGATADISVGGGKRCVVFLFGGAVGNQGVVLASANSAGTFRYVAKLGADNITVSTTANSGGIRLTNTSSYYAYAYVQYMN